MFNIWDENIFVEWRLVVFRFYAYKFKVQFFVMSWKDEVIIPLIRMMTYNIYKTLSPKFLAHAVSLYPFVKNSIIFYSILDVSKISKSQWFRITSSLRLPILILSLTFNAYDNTAIVSELSTFCQYRNVQI